MKYTDNSDIQDVNFTLRLKDGTILTMPGIVSSMNLNRFDQNWLIKCLNTNAVDELKHPITSSTESGDRGTFSSRGLTIERLVPFSKWRITFNGLCCVRKPDNQTETNDDEPQHVVFTFL